MDKTQNVKNKNEISEDYNAVINECMDAEVAR